MTKDLKSLLAAAGTATIIATFSDLPDEARRRDLAVRGLQPQDVELWDLLRVWDYPRFWGLNLALFGLFVLLWRPAMSKKR